MESRQQNRLTRWICDLASAEKDSLAPYRDQIMMSMGAVATIVLTPFTLNNLLQERWPVAAILVVVLGVASIDTWALWRGRRAPIPFTLLLIPFVLGVTIATIVQGVPGILWTYPIVVYCHFVLSRRVAVVSSLALLVYATALAAVHIDYAVAYRLFGSLLVTIIMINIVLNVISDLHRTLARQAMTDPLTGAYNRRFMEEIVEGVVSQAERNPRLCSLLMIDVDHFKSINDRFGHDQGDRVLREIVGIIDTRMRRQDRLFRLGGEEFVLLLENTDLAGAMVVADNVRQMVETSRLVDNERITISIGVAQHQPQQAAADWMRAADQALYRAKSAGRNCVAGADA